MIEKDLVSVPLFIFGQSRHILFLKNQKFVRYYKVVLDKTLIMAFLIKTY